MKVDSIIEGVNKSLNFCQDGNYYIHGAFDETISLEIMPKLIKDIEDKKKAKDAKIKFYIASNGGITYHLKNLLSLFELAKADDIIIETYVFSHAYSCGSMLACAGTKGYRFIGENAEHLCHLGASSSGWVRNDTESDRMSSRIKRHFDFVRRTYKKYASIKNLAKVIHDDNYFLYGQEIIDNGLADSFLNAQQDAKEE